MNRRRGFTMVEILIVIGVIMLLVAIGVIAYRGLDKMASSRATHVALDNAASMLAEYEHGGQVAGLHYSWFDPNATAGDTTPIDSTASSWDVSSNGAFRFNATRNSGTIMERLARIPKNKQALSALPQKALIDQPPKVAPETTTPQAPAMADGWRNPILFVPAGGIQVILDANGSNPRTVLVTSPDHRPFWVSAGPDGDVTKGDDNVYSFAK